MQHVNLVMTLIGKDRPGLVEALSAVIERHGGNWEESRMAQLAGEFAGLLRVEVPEERAGELEVALGAVDGLSVVVARVAEPAAAETGDHELRLELVGQDHPGIVRRIAAVVAAAGINVEELETSVESAPMSGEPLFRAEARLRAPKTADLDDLQGALERLAADLMVDLQLEDS